MAKPRKEGKHINCKIEQNVYDKLQQYCEETGLSKTVAIERALKKEFDSYSKRKEDF